MWAKQKAFTIVELLIVIVVIGILAAITLVAFTGMQSSAADTAVQSDLRNLRTKIELYKSENGMYPAGSENPTELAAFGFKAAKSAYATSPTTANNIWYCRNAARDQFSVVALSKSGGIYYITHLVNPTRYTGAEVWSSTSHNCNTIVASNQGWQYQGYSSADTTNGPWRSWVGGN